MPIRSAFRPALHSLVIALGLCLAAGAAGANELSALLKAKKYADLERVIGTRLQRDPHDAEALIAKSQLITTLGPVSRYEEAVQVAGQCVSFHPSNSNCHLAYGDALAAKVMAGSTLTMMTSASKIRDAYLRAVAVNPANMQARFNLMQYYLMAPSVVGGGKAKVAPLIAETAKVDAAGAKLIQAAFDASDEHYAGAEAQAWAVNPGANEDLQQIQRSTLFRIGSRFTQDKKFHDGERVFAEMQKRFPQEYMGFYGAARVLQEQGRCPEALPLFDKALTLDARASVYYGMAQCLQGGRDTARALAAFEHALSAKPGIGKKQRADAEEQIAALKAQAGKM